MKQRALNIIILFGVVSLALLLVVQFIWAKNLIQVEKKQFNHKVKMALMEAGYELRLIHHSSIQKVHPVKQISEESFVVEVQDIVNPLQIDTILQGKFKEQEVIRPYKIAIYDCFTDSVVYTKSGSNHEESISAEEYGVNWDINSYNFGVIFPKTQQLSSYLWIWLASVAVFLTITGFCIYVVFMFIKQKKLDDMKTDFINNMTHELKTPISTISLSSQVINNPKIIEQPERLKRYAEIIEQENIRLKNQVERVLQIAFFEKDNIQLNFVERDIYQLVVQAISPYHLILEEKKGTIKLVGDQALAWVDEHHFVNVISNLVDNAIKYSKQDVPPHIEIKILALNNKVKIEVSDNGIGMSKEATKNIFKKFYRVPTGNVHDVKGFGIGLSYVELMINHHAGSISVSSDIGKGTKFEIEMPKNRKNES